MRGRDIHYILVALFSICLVLGNSACQGESPEGTAAEISPSQLALKQLEDNYWEYMLEESIYLQHKYGLEITKLPDISLEYTKKQVEYAKSMLEKLQTLRVEDLSHEEELSLYNMKWTADITIEGINHYDLFFPVTPYASYLPFVHRAIAAFKFGKEQDLERYQNLLRQYPRLIGQLQSKLEYQYQKGIILPKEELPLVIPFHKSFIKKGEHSLFYVNTARLDTIEEGYWENFQTDVVGIVNNEINPALERLVAFMSGDYLTEAPPDVGLWQYPNGNEYYQYLIKVNTTLDLTPEEIHKIGLDNIAKNNISLDKIRQQVRFEGTLEEFRHFLKTDPRFFPKTAENIKEKLSGYIKGMEEHIQDYFLSKPKASYGVARLARELEASMTFGFYEPPTKNKPKGTYYFNGSNPEQRSILNSEGLVYHELVPGHHFHIASQSENESLPNFRREILYNSFNEGWAEYAAWLGLEMGLFQDPYSLAGRYMMDNFLSTRLVVDTGMNHMKWPRNKAVKFMQENMLESDTQIHTETLRYSSDIQAQALGYKLGSLKMFELREKAEGALGDKFDIRKFHNAILGSGSMPFPILEKHIDWFIQEELKTK